MGPTPLTREVIGRIERISRDRVHGATFLAAEALRALAVAAEAQPPGDGRVQAAMEAALRLADARAAIAAIKNIARRFDQREEVSGGSFDSDALAGELLAEMKTAIASTALVVLGPITEMIAIVIISAGIAWIASTKRCITRSVLPPRKPLTRPMIEPARVPNVTVRKPA